MPHIRLEVGSVAYRLFGDRDLWVQVANALLRLGTHPGSVAAYILGEALSAPPTSHRHLLILTFGQRPDGRPASKLWRDLDHRLRDQHRDRIEVARQRLKTESLSFQRQRPTATERVM